MQSKLEKHSNNSHSVRTTTGRKNIHKEVYEYIQALEKEVEEYKGIKNFFNREAPILDYMCFTHKVPEPIHLLSDSLYKKLTKP